MLRVGTSDDARDGKLHVNTPKGEITETFSPGRHHLDGPVLPVCSKFYHTVLFRWWPMAEVS